MNGIAGHLGMNQQNVSRDLQLLGDEGLLEIIENNGGSKFWGKKALDRTLRVTKFLCAEYSLAHDGKPRAKK